MTTERTLIMKIRKRQLKCVGNIDRGGVGTINPHWGYIEGKRNGRKAANHLQACVKGWLNGR